MTQPRPANNPVYKASVFPNAVDEINNPDKEIADALMATQQSLVGGGAAGTTLGTLNVTSLTTTGTVSAGSNVLGNQGVFSSGVRPGNGTVASTGRLLGGNGAPTAGIGSDGDFYFRMDPPAVANQRIYVKSAGAWVGIV